MPLLHCSNCHHEYEGIDDHDTCDWCGSTGYIIEDKTPLEKMAKEITKTGVENWLDNINKEIEHEKNLDKHPIFVYIDDKLHLGIATRRKHIECKCGNCGNSKADK